MGKLLIPIVFATLIIFELVSCVTAQACSAASVLSNFTSIQASSVICQVGYYPDERTGQCQPYDTLYDQYHGQSCNETQYCPSMFVCSELSKICVPRKTKRFGETCFASESCAGADMNCIAGVCTMITKTVYDRKLGETCNYLDHINNVKRYCMTGYSCYSGVCYEVLTSGRGGTCGKVDNTFNQTYVCSSSTSCDYFTNKCIQYIRNSTVGENCNHHTADGYYVQCKVPLTCLSGKCYSSSYVGNGEICGVRNQTSYTVSACDESQSSNCEYYSSGYKCTKRIPSSVGGFCGYNGNDFYYCVGGLSYCANGKCLATIYGKLGDNCSLVVGDQYVIGCSLTSSTCRSKYNGAQQTCEYKAKLDEYCYSISDCESGLSCTGSRCNILNGLPVGEKCFYNSACDSGLCLNSVCSLKFNSTACTTDSQCTIYDSKCSCGNGSSSSATVGKCVSLKRCKVFRKIVESCIASNGRGVLSSNVVFDRNSTIHMACNKEFSQYYSCMRIGLNDAGNVPALPIQGLDVFAEIPLSPSPTKTYKCYGYTSDSPDVCLGRGDCIADGVCKCYTGYTGTECDYVNNPNPPPPPTPTPKPSSVAPVPSTTGGRNRLTSESFTLQGFCNLALLAIISFTLFIIQH